MAYSTRAFQSFSVSLYKVDVFVFGRYIKKKIGTSHKQEQLVYWSLIVAQEAVLSLVSMEMINVKHFDILYDINKVAIIYDKDES